MRFNTLVSTVALGATLTGVSATPSPIPNPPWAGYSTIYPILEKLEPYTSTWEKYTCPNGIEARKEWRKLSKTEKTNFISAVKCLADKKRNPHSTKLTASYPRSNIPPIYSDSSLYDDLTYVHMDNTDMIHYTGYFMPWHRNYVNLFKRLLVEKCQYAGVMPYWDWSQDAASFNTSAIWDADPNSGLGTFGDPNDDYYVKNGGFKDMKVSYPITRGIRRQYTPYPYLTWWWVPRPTEAATETIQQKYVDDVINGYAGDFRAMQNASEKAQAMHPNIHMIMGGDMAGTCPKAAGSTCQGGSTWTPNDPIFFLHHANYDRIWWLWQQKSVANKYAFFGGTKMTYSDPDNSNGYGPWANITDQLNTNHLDEVLASSKPANQFINQMTALSNQPSINPTSDIMKMVAAFTGKPT
ncbi:hypothetical protein FRC07_009879, partial [Ceratobasidium sp. 392]